MAEMAFCICGNGIPRCCIPLRGESYFCGIGILRRCISPCGGERGIAEMAFRATGVGTAPHTGTYSFGA
ncbi:MAG: hypothetical protein RSD76_03615, partial [Clostridia bacterium]